MAKYSKGAGDKVGEVLHEMKEGKLETSSGKKVTSRNQAIAIALSEAREEGEKVPKAPAKSKTAAGKKSAAKATSKKATPTKAAAKTTAKNSTAKKAGDKVGGKKTASRKKAS